jgi:uncharacterized membrane protein
MQESLTLGGRPGLRTASFAAGVGMIAASLITIRHFFTANYPSSIYEGSVCDINAFFNCDSSAYSVIAQIGGVPRGYFGLMVGGLVALGAVFPSARFERTNKSIALVNALGVIALFLFSILYLNSFCLFCSVYWVLSLANFALFWKYGIDWDASTFVARYLQPSPKLLATFAVVMLGGAYGFSTFHEAKKDAQSGGVAARIVQQFYNLPEVTPPSTISPFMAVQATERFEDAPIRIVEYGDFLFPDCVYLYRQLKRLEIEFAGQISLAFQHFPLDRQCNDVVDKDKHPGACDLSYISSHRPSRFKEIYNEIFTNFPASKDPEWIQNLAERYEVADAVTDSTTQELVHRIIETGREYEKTSEQYAHGIRSTPTMIINDRMIIGTFPYDQLRAIFQALIYEYEQEIDSKNFIEDWVS